MIRTLDFNAFAAGTVIDDEYFLTNGVTVSAVGGADQAMIFDSNNPTGEDDDLASDTLDGLLIISEDGDSSDPDDNDAGGSIFFDFENIVRIKSLTFKDIEETTGEGTRMIFYDADGAVLENHFVDPTTNGGERTVGLFVRGVSRMEVRFQGSGAIDNLVFDDERPDDIRPTAVDDMAETDEDTPVIIDIRGNDSDPENSNEELTISDFASPDGTVVDNGDGTVTFVPNEDFDGVATFTYTLTDPSMNTDVGEVTVQINPVNDAPVAVDDAGRTDIETPVVIDLLGNDTDVDGDPLTLISATVSEAQGTLIDNGDGTVTYTPAAGFTGDATISYTVSDRPAGDPEGLTDSAEALVSVGISGADRDGIVEGDDSANLIDTEYTGDPDGDLIDNGDAILFGEAPNDDIVRAGGGADTVEAGQGSDEVDGGAGDDLINTGNGDLAPDAGYPFAPDTDALGYDPDTDPENDRDSVFGGAGNDTIITGDDRDTIDGGAGEDVIDGGIDDDLIDGGDDDDRIVGSEGNDIITGGLGDDTIYAGYDPVVFSDVLNLPDEASDGFPFSPDRNPDNDRDFVDGGGGDDLIFGADDDDILFGGAGNDTIDGQIDDDVIDGNAGDDSLIGGQGNDDLRGGLGNDTLDGGVGIDVMTGGAGEDLFINVNAGDVIDGGSGVVDNDTLDLRGSSPAGGRFEVTYTSSDRENGFVTYFNEDEEELSDVLVFEEIENVIPCFTPGTRIATPTGERPVEDLKVGDRVITRDNGIQEIRWVGAREMSGAELDKAAHLRPVLIQKGALGNGLPERDMMVSPNHRILIANDKTALYFEEREVLVAAKHLTGLEGVDVVEVSHTTYIHIMFDQHEVVLSDGSWTESFQPGDMSLAGICAAQRKEIFELFPELATRTGVDGYASARRSLKRHEAKLLTK